MTRRPDATQFTRRRAVLARCPRCKKPTLHGTDSDGLPTHADPTPITRTAELELYLAGWPAYAVEHGELVRRDQWRIRRPSRAAVVPEHRCSLTLPADRLAPIPPRPGHLLPDTDAPCPF